MAAQAGFYLQVERCRALADSATGVIVASMAGAIVASELSSVGNGDAAKVGAHAQDDQPFRILNSLGIRLRIPKGSRVHRCNISNLLGGPVSDEQRLATPLEGHVLTYGEGGQSELSVERHFVGLFYLPGCRPALSQSWPWPERPERRTRS